MAFKTRFFTTNINSINTLTFFMVKCNLTIVLFHRSEPWQLPGPFGELKTTNFRPRDLAVAGLRGPLFRHILGLGDHTDVYSRLTPLFAADYPLNLYFQKDESRERCCQFRSQGVIKIKQIPVVLTASPFLCRMRTRGHQKFPAAAAHMWVALLAELGAWGTLRNEVSYERNSLFP